MTLSLLARRCEVAISKKENIAENVKSRQGKYKRRRGSEHSSVWKWRSINIMSAAEENHCGSNISNHKYQNERE